jgi:dTDP-4-amino-4,6-dideoxygalactose transaminase
MKVPFVELSREYNEIKTDINKAITRTIRASQFVLGEELEAFEAEWARYLETRFAYGVASGTDALFLALKALGIGKGDEVIVPSFSFVATAFAVTQTGAIPIFTEIESLTHTVSPDDIAARITEKTKAVIPVHIYGNPARMDEIMQIAHRNNIYIIEDAAQAHGACYKGKKCGTIGDIGCFSFYPTKNLGGYGDGGAVVTNNQGFADRLMLLRNYGQRVKYYSDIVGYNSRLDGIQAAVLRVKLERLDEWNKLRHRKASYYRELLKGEKSICIPSETEGGTAVNYIFPVQTADRDDLSSYLNKEGIVTLIHYPVPIHRQEAYRGHSQTGNSMKITDEVARTTLSLPFFAQIRDSEIEYVASRVIQWVRQRKKKS